MALNERDIPVAPWGEVWGSGLYESDADLELLGMIAKEAATMMSDTHCIRSALMPDHFTLRDPINKKSTIEKLNKGLFSRLLRRLEFRKEPMAMLVLAAVCMELGVVMPDRDLELVKDTFVKTEIFEEKTRQLKDALEGYENDGTVWTFRMGEVRGIEKYSKGKERADAGVLSPAPTR